MKKISFLKKGDFLILLVILLLCAGIVLYLFSIQTAHKYAIITQDNHTIQQIPLGKGIHREITIDGDYHSTIEIDDSRVRFRESTCGNRLCVNSGWISGNGEAVVCLPNRVILRITGQEEPEVDIVAGQARAIQDRGLSADG